MGQLGSGNKNNDGDEMIMKSVILLGHGSSMSEAQKNMETVAGRLVEKYGYEIVELCSLSGLGTRFDEALKSCVEKGAVEIIVIPYFLHQGVHIKVDIPKMMMEAVSSYPGVSLILGHNLGFDESLVDLVHKRIGESQSLCDIRELAASQNK